MKILVSACLLGIPCRYDGRSKPCKEVLALKERFELIPVCPEQAGGLHTPRVPAERRGSAVVTKNGCDVTKQYRSGAKKTLETAKKHGCKLAVLKEKSPSCGNGTIYDGTFSGTLISGSGVTAQLLKQNGIDVIGESKVAAMQIFRSEM